MTSVLPMHQRLAELFTIRKARPLTEDEQDEMEICLTANANFVWRMITLENLSLMASEMNDIDWLHESCARMEEIQITGR